MADLVMADTVQRQILPVHRDDISALEFDEFFLLDEPVGSEWHGALFDYFQARYSVQDLWVMQPFLVLRCTELPDPVERPFTIFYHIWVHSRLAAHGRSCASLSPRRVWRQE